MPLPFGVLDRIAVSEPIRSTLDLARRGAHPTRDGFGVETPPTTLQ